MIGWLRFKSQSFFMSKNGENIGVITISTKVGFSYVGKSATKVGFSNIGISYVG